MGLGSGIDFGGGMRSSADDGGDGGVENARVSLPTDALLFFGLEAAPAVPPLPLRALVWFDDDGPTSEMGRMRG